MSKMADLKNEMDVTLETIQEKLITICDCNQKDIRDQLSQGLMNDIGRLICMIG